MQWLVDKNTEHRTQNTEHRTQKRHHPPKLTERISRTMPSLPLRCRTAVPRSCRSAQTEPRGGGRETKDARRETAARGRHGEGARRGASLAAAAEEDARAAFRESTPKSPAKQAPAAPLRAQRDKREDGRGRRREDTAAQSNAPRAQRGGGAAEDKKCCRGHRQRGLGRPALVLVVVLERDVLRIALCSARSARNIRPR